jgi:hypothetical protein
MSVDFNHYQGLNMTKRHHKKSDPNDPIQDLIDWQDHRYDPGFWISEWYKKGRLDPETLIWKRANLSSLWRTLLIYPIIAFVLTGPIMFIHEEIPHAGIIVITVNVLVFLGTWFLLHKWKIKAAKDKQGIREDSFQHKKDN